MDQRKYTSSQGARRPHNRRRGARASREPRAPRATAADQMTINQQLLRTSSSKYYASCASRIQRRYECLSFHLDTKFPQTGNQLLMGHVENAVYRLFREMNSLQNFIFQITRVHKSFKAVSIKILGTIDSQDYKQSIGAM